MPFVFVAVEAFSLRQNLMRLYSEAQNTEPIEVFNYRLSRARRVIENVFGIIAEKFSLESFQKAVGHPTTQRVFGPITIFK